MLHLRKLSLTNLATHTDTQVDLPATGLVVIKGSNGSGKSTLLEVVAAACWNESLRGEMPWREGQPGIASIVTDSLQITRKRSKAGTAKLEWQPLAGEVVTYETTTKAQAALEALIGSYDVWRRTCVLSSLDSAAFSLARDSDRKRLLEEFLGLEMFDTALDACRKDKREAASKAQKAEAERNELNLRLSFAESQLQQTKKDQESLLSETSNLDLDSLKTEGKRLASLVDAAAKDISDKQKSLLDLERAKAACTATQKHEEERLRRLGTGACPTCGQNTEQARAAMEEALSTIKQKMELEQTTLDREIQYFKDDLADLQAEHKELSKKVGELREQYRLAESQSKMRASLAAKIEDSKKAVAEWAAKIKAHGAGANKAAADAAHLEAVEQVLGLRGVRAQVLDHALGALEQQANAWLSRMPTDAGSLTLKLTGSTTQKSGSVVDAISLKVRGRAYASCSGGERRRVDVALLLALRELAVAAHGRDGSLLCDEVFDALDAPGQADVAAALSEMAQERLVIVVTHSPELAKALRPNMQLHVSLVDGAASVAVS